MQTKKDSIKTSILQYLKQSIFKNSGVFSADFIPPILKFRDRYINILLDKLAKEIFHQTNFNIFGITGSGKTLSIKYCFKKIEEIWKELEGEGNLIGARTLYISCSDYDNTSKILSYIINKLGGNVPMRGWDRGTYLEELKKMLESFNHVIICFDESDILMKKGLQQLILSLSDIQKISFIFISNIPNWNKDIDPRIRSRLQLEDLEFIAYSTNEIRGILLQRITLGLKENIFTPKILDLIIQKAYYNRGDLRDVIKLFNIIIEDIQYNKIVELTDTIINQCYYKLLEREIIRIVDCLSPPLRLMLLIIINIKKRGKQQLTTTNINFEWNETVKKSKIYEPIKARQILNHLHSLELYNLISIEKKSLGRGKGVINIIEPEFNINLVYNYLYNNKK